jgi:Xaa-Pro aminopeptidase
VALAPGNVVSIEPGYYEDGSFGIRIENIVMVREVETSHSFGDKPFLGFEHVTMVPYCHRLINPTLLTEGERQWLNDYNSVILERTREFFLEDSMTLGWLMRETQPF